MSSWAQDEIERLTQMWEAGRTGREIGIALNRSRNSVISKANKLALRDRGSPIVARDSKTYNEVKFLKMEELIAEEDLPIWQASEKAGMSASEGRRLWTTMCRNGGRQYL